MKAHTPLLCAGLLSLSLGAAAVTRASTQRHAANSTTAQTYTVTVGYGDQGASAAIMTPKYIYVTVGDTVTWRDNDTMEPHTVTFGPKALLTKLATQTPMPLPQKAGPPLMAIPSLVARATERTTYDGTGLASSGLLYKGRTSRLTWSLTFTKPGAYHYYCLIHYPLMSGVVIVRPREQTPQFSGLLRHFGVTLPVHGHGQAWLVQAGDGPEGFNDQANVTASDAFFPRRLTIHAGDTVTWIGGFHTVTFGPAALRDQLEQHSLMAMPQSSGPSQLVLNPKVAFPSGGATYDGTGFVNSGILFLRVPHGSHKPPMYSLTFTKPGTYEYDCLIHPHMEGTITVLPAGA